MKRLMLGGLLFAAACANPSADPRTFAANDLMLAVGNGARMGCSCLFVMKMPEAYCRAWVKASPDVAKVNFDTDAKSVVSTSLVSFSATAHYVDAKRGCVLQ